MTIRLYCITWAQSNGTEERGDCRTLSSSHSAHVPQWLGPSNGGPLQRSSGPPARFWSGFSVVAVRDRKPVALFRFAAVSHKGREVCFWEIVASHVDEAGSCGQGFAWGRSSSALSISLESMHDRGQGVPGLRDLSPICYSSLLASLFLNAATVAILLFWIINSSILLTKMIQMTHVLFRYQEKGKWV